VRLSVKLGIIVGCAILGTVALVLIALGNLRSTMLEDRKTQISMLTAYAGKIANSYLAEEKAGRLSREEAQKKASEALSAMREGSDYVLVRTLDGLALVHADARRVGKVDNGPIMKSYLEALKDKDVALVQIMTKRPDGNVEIPKLNGLVKIPDWGWVIGFGQYIDDIDAAYNKKALSFGAIGLIIVAAVLGSAIFMARNIYHTLGGEPEYAASVARAIVNGDLTEQIEFKGRQDSLMASIRQMQQHLRNIIQNIQQNANGVSEASTSLSGEMDKINNSARYASEAVASTAAAIEELAVSVDHISHSSQETEQSATHSTQLANHGSLLVDEASREIQRVATQVDQASGRIAGLVERSREIGGIANVIKEIADQTNLLALNAAIEAARAGEQGRGFAVVADEVRKLSERTSNATDQITTMIAAIHTDTESVVKGMEAVGPQVAVGIDAVSRTGEALQQINAATAVALSNVSEVRVATTEQSAASSSVARSVERISTMLEESSQSVQSANQNVHLLEKLAGDLRQSVSQFKA